MSSVTASRHRSGQLRLKLQTWEGFVDISSVIVLGGLNQVFPSLYSTKSPVILIPNSPVAVPLFLTICDWLLLYDGLCYLFTVHEVRVSVPSEQIFKYQIPLTVSSSIPWYLGVKSWKRHICVVLSRLKRLLEISNSDFLLLKLFVSFKYKYTSRLFLSWRILWDWFCMNFLFLLFRELFSRVLWRMNYSFEIRRNRYKNTILDK